jgi:competence protein ComEC
VSRLQKVGSKIYSAAEAGNIVVKTNGKTHSVSAKPWSGVVTPAPTPTPQPKPDPTPTTPQPKPDSGLTVIPGAPTSFQNCTAMKKHYPKGVKKGHPAYATKHDRDKDG